MIINGSGFTISLVPRDAISTFILNGVEYPYSNVRGTVILDGIGKNSFVKRLRYQKQVEETKAQMNHMLGR